MDFQSAMETFAEAWVAANTKGGPLADTSTQSQALALTRNCKSPSQSAACERVTRPESREQQEGAATPQPAVTPVAETDSIVSPPSVKDATNSGKSLPVHCVVEAICSVEEPRGNHTGPWRRRPVVETDSFVIIPINTPFQDLVQAALHRLGYPNDSAASAKGSVVMKNWKPLSFDQISDDPIITVGDILGEMTTVATLRIQVFRAKPTVYSDIKDKLLKLLLIQSHGRLLSSGCPLDEHILSHICRSDSSSIQHHIPEPNDECRRKFDQWWASQVNSQHIQNTHSALYGIAQVGKNFERPPSLAGLHQEHVHPAMQTVQNQYPQKTRMRTSFDPELELPKLQRWFAENQHPSRQQIQQYVKELNCLESRRGRKPLDVNNVVYWFKNARAAQKRAEIRNISPGLPCHLSINGYNSNSQSPPNGSGLMLAGDGYPMKSPQQDYAKNAHMSGMSEDMSMIDSDIDEDDVLDGQTNVDEDRPITPNVPLSLTTNRKHKEDDNNSNPASPEDQKIREVKKEPKDEPMDLHSNHNNNKTSCADAEEENNEKNESDNKITEEIIIDEKTERESPRMPEINRQYMRSFSSPNSEPDSQLMVRGGDNLDRLAAGFPLVPNSMFSHSIMYMSHYIPGLAHGHGNMAGTSPPGSSGLSMSALAASAAEERRKRNRTFIDPVTEVPRLEQWFSLNTHPSHNLILKYTEELNCMAYRQKFPRLEPKNVQFWFKNRRAKCKRLKMSLFDNPPQLSQYHHDRE